MQAGRPTNLDIIPWQGQRFFIYTNSQTRLEVYSNPAQLILRVKEQGA
jgi:hypothetical protein